MFKSKSDLTIFQLSPEAIIIIDDKGRITNANKKLTEWLGYTPQEIIGTKISKLPFLSKKNKLFALSQFTKRMAGKKIPPYELEFIAKDKTKTIGLVQAATIKNEKGKNTTDLVMVSDITKRKKAENQLVINQERLERLNKLMIGREYKMAKLKENCRSEQNNSQTKKFLGKLDLEAKGTNLRSSSFFNLSKEIIKNLLKNSFFQILLAVTLGIYVSLIIFLFLIITPFLASVITSFVTFLLCFTIWVLILLQSESHLTENTIDQAMLNLLEDINAEKIYEQIRGKSILENIGESIVITNEKGLIKYVNPAFEKLLGISAKNFNNKDFAEAIKMFYLNGKEIPIHERSDSAAITAKNQKMKVLLECGTNKQIAALLHTTPIRSHDQFRGVIRVIHDISEDFKLQQQKDDFFSIASHELRTPLTVIAGNIDMILQGYGKSQLSPEDKQLLSDAEIATDRLIAMVNEFLNVSRLDQGRLKTNIVELNACKLTDEVIKEIMPLAKKKQLTLTYNCIGTREQVRADENLVKEILINLIGNSIKFTRQGGIRIDQTFQKGWLITTITDTGIGIAKNKQDRLFTRFQQAMSRTMSREAGGTGLGLYISREFVRLMGGDLKLVSSQEGKGSTFSFSLPLISNTNYISST
ncbi:MAG: PAS domain S-box protein [Patescibacteria group bacterium]